MAELHWLVRLAAALSLLLLTWQAYSGPPFTECFSTFLASYFELLTSDEKVSNIKVSCLFILYALLLTKFSSEVICANLLLWGPTCLGLRPELPNFACLQIQQTI